MAAIVSIKSIYLFVMYVTSKASNFNSSAKQKDINSAKGGKKMEEIKMKKEKDTKSNILINS